MKLLRHVEGKFSLLLVFAIMVLCAGFFIVSCGKKPQQKTKNPNKGAYGIDFTHCPAGKRCSAPTKGSEVSRVPDITNKQVTMEAWVKTSVTSTTGTIFKRGDSYRGVELHVESNVPKFTIRRVPGVTGTESFTVDSGVTLATGRWYHIVGLISNADTHNPPSAAMTQTPHLDIYVDGGYKASATTNSNYADNPPTEDLAVGFLNDTVIDELRFWVPVERADSPRSQAQINNCKGTELGIGGECDRGDPSLAAYYRLNEGEGPEVTDWSGNGFSGGFEYSLGDNNFAEWEDGWVTPGAPITPAD